jgi:hypothetical protein
MRLKDGKDARRGSVADGFARRTLKCPDDRAAEEFNRAVPENSLIPVREDPMQFFEARDLLRFAAIQLIDDLCILCGVEEKLRLVKIHQVASAFLILQGQ